MGFFSRLFEEIDAKILGVESDSSWNERESKRLKDVEEALKQENPDITTYPFVYTGRGYKTIRRDILATLKTEKGRKAVENAVPESWKKK